MEERRSLFHERKFQAKMESKKREQAMEEMYDKMINPHLYGGSGGGGYRKVRKGEHYEDVQRERLANEIRIRERRERMERERWQRRDRNDRY